MADLYRQLRPDRCWLTPPLAEAIAKHMKDEVFSN
jgi:hypothetical protein